MKTPKRMPRPEPITPESTVRTAQLFIVSSWLICSAEGTVTRRYLRAPGGRRARSSARRRAASASLGGLAGSALAAAAAAAAASAGGSAAEVEATGSSGVASAAAVAPVSGSSARLGASSAGLPCALPIGARAQLRPMRLETPPFEPLDAK
jgi:hypothetical protein